MLHIPNQQNLLQPLHHTELSIPKLPVNNNYFYFMYLSIESMQKKCYPFIEKILKFFSFLEVLA